MMAENAENGMLSRDEFARQYNDSKKLHANDDDDDDGDMRWSNEWA